MCTNLMRMGVILLLLIGSGFLPAKTCMAQGNLSPESRAGRSFIVDRLKSDAALRPFKLTPHQPTFILPISYMIDPNEKVWRSIDPGYQIDNLEAEFQFSAKMKLLDNIFAGHGDIWFGYTQQSYWQVYNSEESSVFRETNYEPEFWLSFLTDFPVFGLVNRTIIFGLVHESNGRNEPLSRSWNRLYLNFWLERGNFALSFKPWYRIPEDADDDDNPDIEDYMGYGELRGIYEWKSQLFSLLLRNNLEFSSDNRWGIQVEWVFPVYNVVKGYAKYFYGYGDSLVDYNYEMSRFGLGLLLLSW